MRAMQIIEWGQPLEARDYPDPEPTGEHSTAPDSIGDRAGILLPAIASATRSAKFF